MKIQTELRSGKETSMKIHLRTRAEMLALVFVGLQLSVLFISQCAGQTTFGSITGTVADPSGAVVAGRRRHRDKRRHGERAESHYQLRRRV